MSDVDDISPWGLVGLYRSALEDIRDLELRGQGGDTQGQTCCREVFRMRKIAEEAIDAPVPDPPDVECHIGRQKWEAIARILDDPDLLYDERILLVASQTPAQEENDA